jgi:hypothetical protein
MLGKYFDLTRKSNAPLRPTDDEPLPSMFRGEQQRDDPILYARAGSSKGKASTLLLIVLGSFLATVGVLVSFSIFSSEKSAIETADAPAFPHTITTDASYSSGAADAVEAPQARTPAPTQPALAEGAPWSGTMEAYKTLLAKQDSSKASAPKQTTNDPVLGPYEAWLKAKSQ